jgi:hypothetical protein
LATLTEDLAAGWVLELLDRSPTAAGVAQARLQSLQKISYLSPELAEQVQLAARQSVASVQGDVAEALVRDLVAQVRHTQRAEHQLRQFRADAFAALPPSPHLQIVTIPGIGSATAAALVAKTVDIDRFDTPEQFVGYFGVFPEEDSSGVDKQGHPLPPGTLRMSRKGTDLVRHYLWNAARVAIVHNPAIRALYRRLKAKGKRGDVAPGHCMRKLLHLVFAVWKTDRPFDAQHFPWEQPPDSRGAPAPAPAAPGARNDRAVGHKRDEPASEVVTTAASTVAPAPAPAPVKPAPAAPPTARPKVDFAFVRQQVTLAQVLEPLGLLANRRGRGQQRRGPCPIHGQPDDPQRTFSAHLGQIVFQCFHAAGGARGNVLDFWAAVHHLPLYDAALHVAETFRLRRNREEKL